MASRRILALDVGEKRIGVATGDTGVKIAIPLETLTVDGTEVQKIIEKLIADSIETLVIGYPRNQSGEPTAQTAYIEAFARQFELVPVTIVFQDESLTSVLAEERLQALGGAYTKGDIDATAASIILEDYLERSGE